MFPEDENEIPMEDVSPSEPEAIGESEEDTRPESQMIGYIMGKFERAESKRMNDEQRWLRSYRNYRGDYGEEVQFTESEKSRVFVKITKTKVLAAYGQIIEVLFGNNSFPLTVDNTKLPEGVSESVHVDPMAPPAAPKPQQAAPMFGTRDGPQLPAGFTQFDAMKLGPLTEKLEPVKDRLVEGPGTTPTAVTFHPAYVAAKKMEKKIHDQLDESGASKQLRSSAFEMALFGTGIMKGPLAIDKEYPKWLPTGQYQPVVKTVPTTTHVSVWNFYPDPDAANMDECEYVIERHKMSHSQLEQLKKRPYFLKDAIDRAIDAGAHYEQKYWESLMEDSSHSDMIDRWEVMEFWGFVSQELLIQNGVKIPRNLKKVDPISASCYVCNNEILRLVLNPFKPTRFPYYACPYELNPYSFFGISLAENMEDSQLLMNGFMRMAVDNAALSGNLVFEVDDNLLVPGQDLEFYPGKVVKRTGGVVGQAIFAHEFPNTSQQNMMMFDTARKMADESTGFPSYAHGQTGVTGVGRTASGISMLMSAANGGIRTVVKNLDDYLIDPLGRAFFQFNMQFDYDPSIQGDLEVHARGTESLMATEVKSQRLMQFLGVVSNPLLAPFAKLDVIIREIAKTLDLDPDKVTNSLPDAAIQAMVMQQMQGAMEQQAAGPDSGGGGSTPPTAGDTQGSGGGMMGTGSAPPPGAPGFSANNGGGQ